MTVFVKRSMLVAIMLVLALVAAACGGNGGGGNSATNDNGKKHDPVELTVGSFATPDEQKSVEAWFAVYKKTHAWVTLKYVPLEGSPNATALTMAAAGTMPDVIWLTDGDVRNFYEQGLIEPLNDAFDRVGVDINNVNPAMISYGAIDGKYYFAPRDLSHMVVFANKTILDQEGIPLPQDGWTWEDFVNISKQVTKKNDAGETIQWGAQTQVNWIPQFEAMALGWGGDYLNRDTMEVQFSDPKVIEGFKASLDLIKDGYAINNFKQYPADMFMEGKVAFMFGVKPHENAVNDAGKAKGFEWDVVPFPKQPVRYAVGSGTSGYAVNSKSKVKEEAEDFVAMLLTDDAHKAFGSVGLAVPLLKSLEKDPYWRGKPVEGKNDDAFTIHPESDVGRDTDVLIPTKAGQKVTELISDAFSKYIDGKASLEDSLKAADEQINALAKQ